MGAPRLFFVAGESSGDAHGARLIQALRERAPDAECEGLGGVQMARAGMALRHDLAAEGIMGFVEVLRSLRALRALFHQTAARLETWKPDALVLIDYPGFNIRLAKRAHALGIPVVWYISPQVWAWKKGRVKTLARLCRKMLVTFPFEKPIYDAAGLDCAYVGHPLIDFVANRPAPANPLEGEPVVGVLPGSRKQEIARILPAMLGAARRILEAHPRARFYCPCIDGAREAQIRALAGDFPLETRIHGMNEVLSAAAFAMVASGTATVETALYGVPFVVVYRVNPATYALARMLVDIEHIGMVNILAGKRAVPEFVQGAATPERIAPAALELIGDTPARKTMLDELESVKALLGGPGASARAAEEVLAAAKPHD